MTLRDMVLAKAATFFTIWVVLVMPAYSKPYKAAELYAPEPELYGKFVIRMRAAKASGVISNFFLWKDGSELDSIFWEEVDIEVFGKNNATSWQSNIITGLGNRITSEEVHQSGASFGDAYHTFAIEWTPNQIKWVIDGNVVRTSTGGQASDISSPSQMRINFWPPGIPEWVGGWNESVLPLHMFVNWAEYYSWENGQFNLEWRDDFNFLDSGRWSTADWTFEENRADFSPNNVTVSNGYLVLSMTREGQEGFRGTPPTDTLPTTSSNSSSSGSTSSSSGSSTSGSGSSTSGSGSTSSSSTSTSSNSSTSTSSSGQPSSTGGGIGLSGLFIMLGMILLTRRLISSSR